ncbi:hypothetical protein IL306_007129 [Fusarium sp. DS 682]|nr:hypothetical protein IL306_007129 [Fusarium sp. DS 682]
MDQHSIAAVQTLILLGSHHVYHGRPNLSFALLGATIKISHAMGLHRNLARECVDDVEERKRVWWTIYTWDRFASISYGRPLSINDEDCNVGMPCDFIESPFFKAESIEQGLLGVQYSPYQTQLTRLYLLASPALKTIFGSLSAQSVGQHFDADYGATDFGGSPLTQPRPQHLPSHSSSKSPSQSGQSPSFEANASSEYWWSAAVRTARITELPHLTQLATDSHLIAFMAMNLFHAAIVLTLVALSDPLSDPAQAVKRTITRVFQLQELLGQRSALASQSSAVLKNLIFLLLRREGEAMLGPATSKPGSIPMEHTLRLPLEAALNTDKGTDRAARSDLSIAQRLNQSLASVQQIIPPFYDDSIQHDFMSASRNVASQQGPVSQPQQQMWFPPGGFQDPSESLEHGENGVDYGANGLFWLWDSTWAG